jgi:hypothetical protein
MERAKLIDPSFMATENQETFFHLREIAAKESYYSSRIGRGASAKHKQKINEG